MTKILDKDLQEMIDVLFDGIATAFKQLKDGFQYTDIFAFVPVFSSIPEAIKGKENALAYLKDMTEEKENAIVDAIAEKLGDSSENVKNISRRIIRLLAEAYLTYITISAIKSDDLSNLPG